MTPADVGGRTDLGARADLLEKLAALPRDKILILQLGFEASESAPEYPITAGEVIDGLGAALPPPATIERRVVANARAAYVNIRARPGLAKSNAPVAVLANGNEIVVEKTGVRLDSYIWVKIAQGVHSGRYVAQELTKLK